MKTKTKSILVSLGLTAVEVFLALGGFVAGGLFTQRILRLPGLWPAILGVGIGMTASELFIMKVEKPIVEKSKQ